MSGTPVCPECNAPVALDDFQCGQCELLLHPELASGEYVISEPTIVRALLAPPQRGPSEVPSPPPEARAAIHDMATAVFTVPMDAYTVPRVSAGVDIALTPLHPFEAYVASFVDGVQPVPELARAARLTEIEVQVVLKALLERRVVELHRQPRPPPSDAPLPVVQLLLGEEEPVALGEEPPAVPPVRHGVKPPPTTPAKIHTFVRLAAPAPSKPAPAPAPPAKATRAKKPAPAPKPAAAQAKPAPAPKPAPVVAKAPPAPPPAPVVAPPAPAKAPTPVSASPVAEPKAPASRAEPPAQDGDFLQAAIRLERTGNVDGAIEVLKRALERASVPAALYNKLALVLINQRKDYGQAATLLERAVELEPDNSVYQQNLRKVAGLAATRSGPRTGKP